MKFGIKENQRIHKSQFSKKGSGYHLDLLVVAIAIGINSFIGLPWFVAGRFLNYE